MHRSTRAFTFAEIVVVTLVLMLGIIPIYQTMVSQSEQTRFSRQAAFAAAVATNVVEIYKRLSIKDLNKAQADGKFASPLKGDAPDADPILFPWNNEQLRPFLDAGDSSLGELMKAYRKEMDKYTIKVTVTPGEGAHADRYCKVQALVSYEVRQNSGSRTNQVPAVMLLTDPCFPKGKI